MLMRTNAVDAAVYRADRTHVGLAHIDHIIVCAYMEIRHRVEVVHALARNVVVTIVTICINVGRGGMCLRTGYDSLLCQGGGWGWDGIGYGNHHITRL